MKAEQDGVVHGETYKDIVEIPGGLAKIESRIDPYFISDVSIMLMQVDECDSGARAFLLSMSAEEMENFFFKVWDHCTRLKREQEERKKRAEEAKKPLEIVFDEPPAGDPPVEPPVASTDDDIPF